MNRSDRRRKHVAIIGAGVAGLAAAAKLESAEVSVTLFDKGRSVGGRVSTRRHEPFAFDHGAQYFTCRGAELRSRVQAAAETGAVRRWDGRIAAICEKGVRPFTEDSAERFVGVPRMSSFARFLAAGLDVRTGTRVTQIERMSSGWRLRDASGGLGEFDGLVVTAPTPQARELIEDRSPIGQQLEAFQMLPCWAVMLGLSAPFDFGFDAAFCRSSELSWIARDSSKPKRGDRDCWVLHASPEWSSANLGLDRTQVIEELIATVERITSTKLPEIEHRDAHLWRFARPAEDSTEGCLVDSEAELVVAGDAFLGGRVEGAYRSGVQAAKALLSGWTSVRSSA